MELKTQPMVILPDSYKLYINYNTLKTLLKKQTYDNISNYALSLIEQILKTHSEFELHMDLNGFTATSIATQGDLLKNFCTKLVGNDTPCTKKLKFMHVYNTPHMMSTIEHICSPYTDSSNADRYVYHSKKDSIQLLKTLFNRY